MLPTGTITFLFTDIEGSTQRWDRDRAAMQDAVRRHDAIVRAAVEKYGGYVFKTIGDAFCAAFSTAGEAVAMTATAQRALAAEDFSAVDGLRVRMALNTGTADERDGDYYGPTLNRVARLLSIGHGGQVLLTKDTYEHVRLAMPENVSLRDMGPQRLKDLAEPEYVYQLAIAGLQHDFAQLKSLAATPNNLPAPVSSFVGRETESAEVAAMVQANRLVTLLGTGGIGKTRLSLHVANALLGKFPSGAWFVEFAAVAEGTLVPETIASVLNLPEVPGRSTIDNLIAQLKNDTALLIFDNCEHLVHDVAKTTEAILQACAHVKVLASTRELLGVSGEQAYRLPTLGLPPADALKALTAAKAKEFGAVALFADRAKAANPKFELTDENAPIVGDVCRRLDGIALAIELAAARVKMLSIKALSEKLDERFRVLTGGSRTALPRQQTLRAMIDWSHDLLSEKERALFRRLAVFAGGFTLELAGAVCGDDALDDFEIMDLLAQLHDKSLVVAEDSGDDVRYDMLESIRAYAREKLEESGDLAALYGMHAAAFVDLAERLETEWVTTPESDWNARAKPEMENWRAALSWAFGESGDAALGRRLAATMRPAWSKLSVSEGRRWIGRALEAGSNDDRRTSARLELAAAHLANLVFQPQAGVTAAQRAIELFDPEADALARAQAQMFAGAALGLLNERERCETELLEALATFRRLGAKRDVGATLQYLARERWGAGDVAGTQPLLVEALEILRETPGSERPAAHIALILAEVEFHSGNSERAIELANEALATDKAFGNEDGVVFDLCNLAAYSLEIGRFDEAAKSASDALAAARAGGIEIGVFVALQRLAAVAALRPGSTDGKPIETAARLIGFVDARFSEMGMTRDLTERREYDAAIGALGQHLSQAELERLMSEGALWSEDAAVRESTARIIGPEPKVPPLR